MSKQVFAIDVGGVLASQQHDGEPIAGALAALIVLNEVFELQLISMCGPKKATATYLWLRQHGLEQYFKGQTYIPYSHQNKNAELVRVKASFFIDDRWKHIGPALEIKGLNCFHLNTLNEKKVSVSPQYNPVETWEEVMFKLMLKGLIPKMQLTA